MKKSGSHSTALRAGAGRNDGEVLAAECSLIVSAVDPIEATPLQDDKCKEMLSAHCTPLAAIFYRLWIIATL